MDLKTFKEKIIQISKGIAFFPVLGIIWGLEEEYFGAETAKTKFAIIGNLIVLWALVLGCIALW